MQKAINDIVVFWPNVLKIKQNACGSVTAIIATDVNGDIGITSENCELTVFGLGSHIHYFSHINDLDEVRSFVPEIIIFIDDLIHCRIAAFDIYTAYTNGVDPACGGFGRWKNETISIDSVPKLYDRIVVRLHGMAEKTISHSQVSSVSPN